MTYDVGASLKRVCIAVSKNNYSGIPFVPVLLLYSGQSLIRGSCIKVGCFLHGSWSLWLLPALLRDS